MAEDEDADRFLYVALGNFAYGVSRYSANKDKIGWISKIHANYRVTIKYPNGKSATWSRKNIVVIHPDDVCDDVKECELYKAFMTTLSEVEEFSPAQCEVLNDFKRWIEDLQKDINDNKNNVTALSSVITEKLNQTNVFVQAMSQHVQGLTEENERLREITSVSDDRITELEDAVRELSLNTLTSGNRGIFVTRFPRLNGGTDANTQVTESSAGDTDPVSSMSEVIDLEHLHQ